VGAGTPQDCVLPGQDKACKKICKDKCREECNAKPECPETCNLAVTQSRFCKKGTEGPLSAADLGNFASKKEKFCTGAIKDEFCPVSCDECPVESCDAPLQTLAFCEDGVAPSGGLNAQEKRDQFCSEEVRHLCPVSCGNCIVESCDDLLTTNPECRLGVTKTDDYDAQAKKDKYCTPASQEKCPVSCMGVTNAVSVCMGN